MGKTSATEITITVLNGDEWQDNPDLPWTHLEGIDTSCAAAYGLEFRRVSEVLGRNVDFSAWWAQTPFRRLRMSVSVPDPRWPDFAPKPGARKNGKDLVLQVVTQPETLPPMSDIPAVRARAAADLYQALVDLARVRRFPTPPPMPTAV